MGPLLRVLDGYPPPSTRATSSGCRTGRSLRTLVYTGAQVGAVSRLQVGDLRDHGNHWRPQFSEKGGKSQETPVRHDLDDWIADDLEERASRVRRSKGSA